MSETTTADKPKAKLVPDAKPTTAPPIHFIGMPDGKTIQFCPREFRPPGELAPQDTDASGVWVRIAESVWWKTAIPGIKRAMSIALDAITAEAALALLKSQE